MAELTGIKHDSNKVDLTYLEYDAISQVALVFAFGARKYTRSNYLGGFLWLRVAAASLRHTYAWISGEDKDSESGYSHLAHACCCLLMLLTFEARRLGEDNRYKESKIESIT